MASRQSLLPGRQSLRPRNALQQITDQVGNMSLSRRSTIARSSLGRTSLYGRPSVTNPVVKDPRPIKDKRFQQNAIQKLIQFLVSSGYQQQISAKMLQSPSSKDFQSIFKFLYTMIDPSFTFDRKFEEEVPVLLKGIRYPFADQINKSNLFTVGSLHAWPVLLAMLIWMVELIISIQELELAEENGDDSQQADRIFLNFLSKAYTTFLNTESDSDIIDRPLLEQFEEKDASVRKDLEKIERDLEHFGKEWEQLSHSESPLTILERERTILESDNDKLKNFIEHLETKRQKLAETVVSLKQECKASEEMLKILQDERTRLNRVIDAQELSPADVDRMNAERDQLAKSIALSGDQLDKINKQVWSKEIEIQKKMDLIERECGKLNSYLYQLDMIGNTTQRFKSLSKELEIYITKQRPDEICSINLRKQAKPVIHALIESIKNSVNKILDECLSIQEKIDITGWSIVNKEEEIKRVQSSIKTMNERYLVEKEQISKSLTITCKDIEQMERTIQQLKSETSSITNQSKTKLQKTQRMYEDSIKRMNNERDQLLQQSTKGLTVAFHFETQISEALEELHSRVQESITAIQ